MIQDLSERIKEEIMGVQAYVDIWRGSTTVQKKEAENVVEKTQTAVSEMMYPWPTIQQDPTSWNDDARFAKSFPLSFPMGTGDFRQPRLRSDFNSLE